MTNTPDAKLIAAEQRLNEILTWFSAQTYEKPDGSVDFEQEDRGNDTFQTVLQECESCIAETHAETFQGISVKLRRMHEHYCNGHSRPAASAAKCERNVEILFESLERMRSGGAS